uniref:Putative licpodalin-4 1 n=1 Tax=Amblyomma triste TaxID=251400 RepID=A0A023G9D1_AMBTT
MGIFGCVCILASVMCVSGIFYEENPAYFHHQQASEITLVNDLLYVKEQSQSLYQLPANPCQAMRRLSQVDPNTFKFIVYYALPAERSRNAFVTTLTTTTTGTHAYPNSIAHQTLQGGHVFHFKVMFADQRMGCFILTTFIPHYGKGCRLLQTSASINKPVPRECDKVYSENCPKENVRIYYPHCPWGMSRIVSLRS